MAIGTATAIIGAVTRLAPQVRKIVERVTKDPVKQQELEKEFLNLLASQDAQQAAINLADAKSDNWFQYSWRPAICWATGFAWVLAHVAPMIAVMLGANDVAHELRNMSDDGITTMLLGLLGMSGLRSMEKIRKIGG